MKIRVHTKCVVNSAKGDILLYPNGVYTAPDPLPACMQPLPRWAEIVPDDTPEHLGDRDVRGAGPLLGGAL